MGQFRKFRNLPDKSKRISFARTYEHLNIKNIEKFNLLVIRPLSLSECAVVNSQIQ